MGQAILGEITEGEGVGLLNLSAVRLVHAGEHAKQRRLAGAVGPAEPDAIPVPDPPADVIEEDFFAKRFGDLLELDHSWA